MNRIEEPRYMRVERPEIYNGGTPPFHLPREIGCYSIDSDGRYRNDNSEMKYLWMPEMLTGLHMDLNEGYDEYIDIHEDTEDGYHAILKWIVSNIDLVKRNITDRHFSESKVDFVFFRGLLTHVGSTIYEKLEDWIILATKFKSVIYLNVYQTPAKSEQEENATEQMIRMASYGFKFEQHMVSDKPYVKPDTSVPVNENEKFYSVMEGQLGHHSLLFGAEVDGVDPKHSSTNPSSKQRYIELKTSRVITSAKQDWNFKRYKLLKWFLQSYFAGILHVICGFRDDGGVVRQLNIFKVRDMPELAQGLWLPGACLKFACEFLDYVKECVVKDDPRVAYRFYWEPGSDIICKEHPKCQLLPEWYISKVSAI